MRVLVSGAGFSKCWGYPLTWEISSKLKELLERDPPAERAGTSSQFIIDFLEALEASDAEEAPDDYEEMLTELHAAASTGDLSFWEAWDVDPGELFVPDPEYWYNQLQWGLGVVLNWGGWGAPPERLVERWRGPPAAYTAFLKELGPFDAYLTLNYDIIPEQLVGEAVVDYALPEGQLADVVAFHEDHQASRTGQPIYSVETIPWERPEDGVPILKVHGSANMAYCPACEQALVFPERVPGYHPAEQLAWLSTSAYRCAVHCAEPDLMDPPSTPERLHPMLVPPVENKEELPAWNFLEAVQERAIELASQADEAVIVGTSVRSSDRILHDILTELADSEITFIGGDDAKQRLDRIVGPVDHPRNRLETDPDQCQQPGSPRRGRALRFILPSGEVVELDEDGDLKEIDEPPVTSLRGWLELPVLPVPGTYYLEKVGGVSVAPSETRKAMLPVQELHWSGETVLLPTATAVVDGETTLYRLPPELSRWAFERMGVAQIGFRDIPARVRFGFTRGRTTATILGRW